MATKLTKHQMMILKGMVEFAEATATQIHRIMKNHGLDKIEGCYLNISVDPTRVLTTMNIVVGSPMSDFGYIDLAKGGNDNEFSAIGNNSAEYELLFANETIRSRMEKAVQREKPLPPDGLWVGSDRNSDPVDCREWDINDSLS